MTDQIDSVMTPREWANEAMDEPSVLGDIRYVTDPTHVAKIIALANAALPDDDPRKITRAKLETMRHAIDLLPRADDESYAEYLAANALVDGLESYLPPETQ